jgi:hypothetical protein
VQNGSSLEAFLQPSLNSSQEFVRDSSGAYWLSSDHLSIDLKGQRLFVTALGNNSLEVIDVKENGLLQGQSEHPLLPQQILRPPNIGR